MTYSDIIQRAIDESGIIISDINSMCLNYLNKRRKMFCNGHSFSWLTIEPAPIVTLPSSTYSSYSGWFDQGWLVVQPNTVSYSIKMLTTPASGSAGGFSDVPVEKLKYVHRYNMDDKGQFEGALDIVNPREFFATYAIEDTHKTVKCCTLYIPYHTTDQALLYVKPTPTDRVLLAISFVPEQLPDIVTTDTSDYISTMFGYPLINGIIADIFRVNGLMELSDKYETLFNTAKVEAIRKDTRMKSNDAMYMPYHTGVNAANFGEARGYVKKMYGSD